LPKIIKIERGLTKLLEK